jgi:tRNA A37 methylthiotransferase MiaB
MTTNWKKATRAKRRYSKPYSKNKTQENFKLMKQWRNEATKERRKAIKNCWKQVAHGQMKSNPRQFYETFMPFLEKKGKENCREGMSLNIAGKPEGDQQKVAEHLANCFATIADGIGGDNVSSLTEHDFTDYPSIQTIKS